MQLIKHTVYILKMLDMTNVYKWVKKMAHLYGLIYIKAFNSRTVNNTIMYMLKNPHVINLMFQCNNLPWAEGFVVEMGGDLCNRDINNKIVLF